MARLFFCDYPQVLLSALPPTARKGECEGGTFDGFPHSRSIARPQATTFAEQKCCSKKEKHPAWVSFFFGAGDEARLATGIPRMAEPFAGALPDLLI